MNQNINNLYFAGNQLDQLKEFREKQNLNVLNQAQNKKNFVSPGNNQFNLNNNEPIRNKELNEISSLYQRKKNEIIQDKKIDIYRPIIYNNFENKNFQKNYNNKNLM